MNLMGVLNIKTMRRFWFHPPRNLVWFGKGLILVLALLIVVQTPKDTHLKLDQTRPVIIGAAIILGSIGLWGMGTAVWAGLGGYKQIAWRMGLRSLGWFGVAGSMIGIILMIAADPEIMPIAGTTRAVESILPLVIGLQAAFLFSPDDEPCLEVLVACPRPISWLLIERLLLLFLLQTVVAVIAIILSQQVGALQNWMIVIARWVSPSLFLCGMGVYITLCSRNPAFGAAMTGLMWFAFSFLGSALLPGFLTAWPFNLVQPFLWSTHGYLQPDAMLLSDYWLNRIVVGSIGILLLMRSVFVLHDEEWTLFAGKPKQNSDMREAN